MARLIMNRRKFVGGAAAVAGSAIIGMPRVRAGESASSRLSREFQAIERTSGGRLGVAMKDTHTGEAASHRSAERFPMCSTFKLLAVGGVLARVDAGQEQLSRHIRFEAKDIVVASPVTKERVAEGMSLAELCAAAITRSDNTAGNLILASLGGPQGLTSFARKLGDTSTRLDRIEPDLNEAIPGDVRDTTTPDAMLADIQTLVLGQFLSDSSRKQLTDWLIDNKTSGTRLRAGLPEGWRVADKTGAGERGTTNDVGVIWPPGRQPVILCVYLTETQATPEQCNAIVAAVGRAVRFEVSGT
jgi:beta-lactamase class A